MKRRASFINRRERMASWIEMADKVSSLPENSRRSGELLITIIIKMLKLK